MLLRFCSAASFLNEVEGPAACMFESSYVAASACYSQMLCREYTPKFAAAVVREMNNMKATRQKVEWASWLI